MNKPTPHTEILKALELSKNTPKPSPDGGWMAVITIQVSELDQHQRTMLSGNLIGLFNDDRSEFLVIVSDNLENPVLFDNEELAKAQARQLGMSLISKYCFSVYCTTGEVVRYAAKPTLHFMPSRYKIA